MLSTWYYHPLGSDNNGNNGPYPLMPGWMAISGRTLEEAIRQLPQEVQDMINAFHMRQIPHLHAPHDMLADAIGITAGWNIGFTLLNEFEWAELQKEG